MKDGNLELSRFVARHFPAGLKDLEECLKWVSQQVDRHIGVLLAPLYQELQNAVREIQQERREGYPGVFALFDPGGLDGTTSIKTARSIVEKMMRSVMHAFALVPENVIELLHERRCVLHSTIGSAEA